MRCVSAAVKRQNLSVPLRLLYLLRLQYQRASIPPSWHEISGRTAVRSVPESSNTLHDPNGFLHLLNPGTSGSSHTLLVSLLLIMGSVTFGTLSPHPPPPRLTCSSF